LCVVFFFWVVFVFGCGGGGGGWVCVWCVCVCFVCVCVCVCVVCVSYRNLKSEAAQALLELLHHRKFQHLFAQIIKQIIE